MKNINFKLQFMRNPKKYTTVWKDTKNTCKINWYPPSYVVVATKICVRMFTQVRNPCLVVKEVAVSRLARVTRIRQRSVRSGVHQLDRVGRSFLL